VEKGVLRFADIDERRVHPLDHALNLTQINRADMALLIGDFEKKLS
jgi:hypothetical protein